MPVGVNAYIYLNPTAIICDLKELQPAIFNEDFQRRRAGIHSILDEFFESVHRGDDDLAGCNLIHDVWIQRLICSRGRTVSKQGLSFVIFSPSSSRATPRKGVAARCQFTLIRRAGRGSSGMSSALRFLPAGASRSISSMSLIYTKPMKSHDKLDRMRATSGTSTPRLAWPRTARYAAMRQHRQNNGQGFGESRKSDQK